MAASITTKYLKSALYLACRSSAPWSRASRLLSADNRGRQEEGLVKKEDKEGEVENVPPSELVSCL